MESGVSKRGVGRGKFSREGDDGGLPQDLYRCYPRWLILGTYMFIGFLGTVCVVCGALILLIYAHSVDNTRSNEQRLQLIKYNSEQLNEINKDLDRAHDGLKEIRRELEKKR